MLTSSTLRDGDQKLQNTDFDFLRTFYRMVKVYLNYAVALFFFPTDIYNFASYILFTS